METDPYIKGMFGENAIQLGVNFIVQGDLRNGIATGVFQSTKEAGGVAMMFGSEHTHQLILGDMILRPHLVIGSDAFRGHGITGLMTSAWTDTEGWMKGKVLLDVAGRLKSLR